MIAGAAFLLDIGRGIMPNSTMEEKSSRIQEALARIRSGQPPEATLRKRKIARGIILINVILLGVMYFLLYRPSGESTYHSGDLRYGDLQLRHSLSLQTQPRRYILTLTVKTDSARGKTYYFNGSLAGISFNYGEAVIFSAPVGENVTSLRLLAGELKTFSRVIELPVIRRFAKDHPGYVIREKRTLVSLGKNYIPLQVLITLNANDPVTVTMNLNFEVE